jgi:hypothetical protein
MREREVRDAGTVAARLRQEREIALAHSLAAAESALAREAAAVGRLFDQAGIGFDARTFVALRVIEASLTGGAEPLDCLHALAERGVLDRSVGLARALLEADAA